LNNEHLILNYKSFSKIYFILFRLEGVKEQVEVSRTSLDVEQLEGVFGSGRPDRTT
jgi:hypothetical protein